MLSLPFEVPALGRRVLLVRQFHRPGLRRLARTAPISSSRASLVSLDRVDDGAALGLPRMGAAIDPISVQRRQLVVVLSSRQEAIARPAALVRGGDIFLWLSLPA